MVSTGILLAEQPYLERTRRVKRNRRIAERTARRLAEIGTNPRAIRTRLACLEREWDIERVIETNAATAVLAGTILGLTVSRWFFALPLAVGAFLLEHAIEGWAPPVPPLRHLGLRTEREIEDERHELLRRLEHTRRRGGKGRVSKARRPRLAAA